MPPKRRKVQLAAARKNKALKNAINETLLNDDDELLSDCYNSDDDWHDVEQKRLNRYCSFIYSKTI